MPNITTNQTHSEILLHIHWDSYHQKRKNKKTKNPQNNKSYQGSGELERLCIAGCSLCEKKVQQFLKKFNTELPYDSVILLLEPKENNQKQGLGHYTTSVHNAKIIIFFDGQKKKKDGNSPKFPLTDKM